VESAVAAAPGDLTDATRRTITGLLAKARSALARAEQAEPGQSRGQKRRTLGMAGARVKRFGRVVSKLARRGRIPPPLAALINGRLAGASTTLQQLKSAT
jgi:hypothetical protein